VAELLQQAELVEEGVILGDSAPLASLEGVHQPGGLDLVAGLQVAVAVVSDRDSTRGPYK
jgi:hypothetical protein